MKKIYCLFFILSLTINFLFFLTLIIKNGLILAGILSVIKNVQKILLGKSSFAQFKIANHTIN